VKKLTILTIVLFTLRLSAQPVVNQPFNVPPLENATYLLDTRPATFEEYLVQLTWKNSPEIEGSNYEIDARRQEIFLAKKEWTRNLQAGLNFNDVSFPYFVRYSLGVKEIGGKIVDTSRFTRIATSPLWQIGVSLNFGDLIVRKHKVKYAQNKVKISEWDQNLKKQKLRGEVLKRYQEFLSSRDILKVRLQSLDAAEANKVQIANLFSVNKVKFEDYNTANKAYFDALENKVRGEGEIKVKKIALEELLGCKWERIEPIQDSYLKSQKN
jgi:outer membrane protein TolC